MKQYSCTFEVTMDIIGGKWSGIILYRLMHGRRRTGELKRLIPNISQKMLIQTLRELEDCGLISRKMYNQVPPKVTYGLTQYGESLVPIFQTLCDWGEYFIDNSDFGKKIMVLGIPE